MAWAVAAPIIAQGLSTGFQAYMNYRAMIEDRKEARRTEALQIKFAEEETERQEKYQGRSYGLQKEGMAISKANQRLATSQSVLDGMSNMYKSNTTQAMNMMKFNQSRA